MHPLKLNLFSSSFTRSCLFSGFYKETEISWLSFFFFRPLQRMCAGMLLAAFSFMMAAFVQIAIQVRNEEILILSIFVLCRVISLSVNKIDVTVLL